MSIKIPNEPHKAVLLTAVGTTVLIAIGAFVLSFAALTDLAGRSGIDAQLAWIWPIIVDGMIVASTVAIVALNGHNRRAMIYPWTLLFFGAIVSTAANSVHAILTVDTIRSGIPPVVSALVAAMPPVVLLAITHLTVHMFQKRAEVAELHRERAVHEQEALAQVDIGSATLERAYQVLEGRGEIPTEHSVATPPPPGKSTLPATPDIQAHDQRPPALYEETVQAFGPADLPTHPADMTTSDQHPTREDSPKDDPKLGTPVRIPG